DRVGGRGDRRRPRARRVRDPRSDERQSVPLRRLPEHRRGDRRGAGRALMRAFEYVVADSPAAARTLVREVEGARFYAGGTTLIDLMKSDVERPRRVVDISRLPLAAVERRGGVVRIGALGRNSD